MAEITGGELKYIATMDTSPLDKSLLDSQGKLKGFSEVAELTGEQLDNALKGNIIENLKKIGLQSGLTGKDMKDAIKDTDEFIKGMELGLKGVLEYQSKLWGEIEKMPSGDAQAQLIAEYDSIGKEIEGVIETISVSKTILQDFKDENASLAIKLRDVKQEMQQLVDIGQKDSEKYRELTEKAKGYQDAIDRVNGELKALSGNQALNMVVETLGLASGAFATAQGVIGLFAGENEDLDRIMVKMQATMSVAIGLQQLQNALSKEGAFNIGVLTKAKELWAVATGRLTVALGGSTVAANVLMATLTLGLSAAIAGIIYLFDRYEAKMKQQADLNSSMADSVAEPILAYKNLQLQWNALGNDLKAKEKFVKDNKEAFKDLGVSVNGVSDAENVFVKNSTNVQAAMMMRARAAAAMQLATEEYKKALSAQMQNEDEQRILKNGSAGEKIVVRSKINGRMLVGTSLQEQASDGFNNANNLLKRSTGYSKSEQDFIKNSGLKPYEEIEKEKKALREKNKPTKKDVADEFLPPGSVAEIQKRLSAIDEALSKATDKGSIEALKKKRIAAAEELAEALKKIEIKSLEDRASAQEKYSEAYNIIAELQGKEAADKMYGPLMEGAQSYYGWLTNEQDKLIQKGGLLSETDKQNLVFLTQKINEIEGKKNAFQNFTDGIDEALAKIPTLAGQLEFLQNKADEQLSLKGNKSFDDGEQKFLKEKQDALLQQQKENYQQFLNEHKSFEEQKDAITEKYNNLRAQSKGDKIAIAKIDKAEQDELSNLTMEIIKQSAEWQAAFGEMEYMSKNALDRILASLLEFKAKSAGTLAPTEMRELEEAIKRVEAAQQRNPFTAILRSFTSYKTALQTVTAAQLAYNKAVAEFGRNSKEAQAAQEKLTRADIDAAKAKQNLVGSLQKGQEVFNAIGNGVKDLGDAFGGFDDATNDAIGNIMDIGNAAFDLGKSIASGDVAGMISAGIKLIGSIGKALSGDQKKERNIKKQAAQLKQLETAYNSLAFAAERAFGSQKYSGQRDLIKNLEQQKAVLQSMLATESSKKKADKEKMAGYQSQIQQINQSIAQIKEGIIKDVLQTDVIDAAAKVGDALVDAFSRGEDSVKSLENAANDMIKNLLRNQLNLALQNKMKPILDQLLASSGFNQDGSGSFTGLTPEQIAAFKAQVVAAGQSMQGFLDGYADIFGSLDPANAQGLKGDIKGVTEKTAGALEAQINAMRIIQADMHNVGKNNQQTFIASLQMLVMIEANTRNLIQIRQDISEMNGKMTKGLAGI